MEDSSAFRYFREKDDWFLLSLFISFWNLTLQLTTPRSKSTKNLKVIITTIYVQHNLGFKKLGLSWLFILYLNTQVIWKVESSQEQ